MEKELLVPVEISEKELRKKQTEKIIDFLTKASVYEFVERIRQTKEGERPTFEMFKDFLVRVNGILRDIPISERKFDGETVYITGPIDTTLMPKHEDKEGILEEAYEASKNLPNTGDEAYLLPAMVNAVHLFADGNGRTSRVLNTLLTSKSKEDFTKNLSLAVSEDGRFNTQDINPGLLITHTEKIILIRHGIKYNKDDGRPEFPVGFSSLFDILESTTTPKAKKFFELINNDAPYCFISALEYLKEKGILEKTLNKDGQGVFLSPAKMEKELSDEDWNEIMKKYYELKKEDLEVIISAFIQPDEYKDRDGSMNLRDYFIQEIKRKTEKNSL